MINTIIHNYFICTFNEHVTNRPKIYKSSELYRTKKTLIKILQLIFKFPLFFLYVSRFFIHFIIILHRPICFFFVFLDLFSGFMFVLLVFFWSVIVYVYSCVFVFARANISRVGGWLSVFGLVYCFSFVLFCYFLFFVYVFLCIHTHAYGPAIYGKIVSVLFFYSNSVFMLLLFKPHLTNKSACVHYVCTHAYTTTYINLLCFAVTALSLSIYVFIQRKKK